MRPFAVEALRSLSYKHRKSRTTRPSLIERKRNYRLLTDLKPTHKWCSQYYRCGEYVGFLLTVV